MRCGPLEQKREVFLLNLLGFTSISPSNSDSSLLLQSLTLTVDLDDIIAAADLPIPLFEWWPKSSRHVKKGEEHIEAEG